MTGLYPLPSRTPGAVTGAVGGGSYSPGSPSAVIGGAAYLPDPITGVIPGGQYAVNQLVQIDGLNLQVDGQSIAILPS